MYTFNREEYNKRMEWYLDARFGMFIHWGLYSIPARGEWVRSEEEIPKEDYMKYFEEFDPVDYDPRAWARAAKEAGMKYVVLTAKHHDGFCLYDSQYTDFKSTNTKCGRDLIKEYGQGLTAKVCHNLGCAFSYLFQMEKALEYFRKEWESGGERQALKTCLLALHSVRTEEEYKAQARELGADDELMSEVAEVLRVFAAKPGITVEKEKTDALLEKLTGEYHRGTGS